MARSPRKKRAHMTTTAAEDFKIECFPNQEVSQSQATTISAILETRGRKIFPLLLQNSCGRIQLCLQMTVDQMQTSFCMFVFQACIGKKTTHRSTDKIQRVA